MKEHNQMRYEYDLKQSWCTLIRQKRRYYFSAKHHAPVFPLNIKKIWLKNFQREMQLQNQSILEPLRIQRLDFTFNSAHLCKSLWEFMKAKSRVARLHTPEPLTVRASPALTSWRSGSDQDPLFNWNGPAQSFLPVQRELFRLLFILLLWSAPMLDFSSDDLQQKV